MKDTYILGIESSCDETAASIVKNGCEILSNVVLTQIERHRIFGGVVPEIASRLHIEGISHTVDLAIEKSGIAKEDISAIAVTAAPGLIGSLLVGVNYAKALSLVLDKPLVPVHHLRGHIAANYLYENAPKPPFLCLIASGGHSHIVIAHSYTDFEVIGRTRDDAAGEAFDKAARAMGLSYPGGVEIDKRAVLGNKNAFKLPHPHLDTPYDYSFSGLKTAVLNTLNQAKMRGEELNLNDLCASFQDTVCDILTEKLFLAARDRGIKTVVAAGGVCANSGLREYLKRRAEENGCTLYYPPVSLCGDNAAMIAAQGYHEFLKGVRAPLSLNAYATMDIANVNFSK
ncbi:MAG: tRNA (adenosine(37)-N6)-threonylcarbamoyltransferase complex transferase subunit TsaD [Ruminococcaceae bacterium]|nr:tRNA (adenosine(37)-N6)-threonylcarbamoyltransferase complex transferase subunit TsaD [Oscillospiraceae bacterium]